MNEIEIRINGRDDTAAPTRQAERRLQGLRRVAVGVGAGLAAAGAAAGGLFAKGVADNMNIEKANDLLAGQLDQAILTDGAGAEHARHFGIRPGDLLAPYGGDGDRVRMAWVPQFQADAIVRVFPPTFPLETVGCWPLDVRAWPDGPRRDQGSQLAYSRHDGQRSPVWLLAHRPAELQRQAMQRLLHAITASFADEMVRLTTLVNPVVWPDATIWRVCAACWHVELCCSHVKQLLGQGRRTLASALSFVGCCCCMHTKPGTRYVVLRWHIERLFTLWKPPDTLDASPGTQPPACRLSPMRRSLDC